MGTDVFFTAPVLCYFLDGFLIIYCIVATAFFFREKFSSLQSAAVAVPTEQENNGCIYQELDRPTDADPYQVLEPSKGKKRARKKKKKSESTRAEEGDKDPYESLVPSVSAPPLPPH